MSRKYQKSNFIAQFKRLNNLARAGKWPFADGTEFGAKNQWWGEKEKRKVSHAGLDFCHYQEADGRRINAEGLMVPAIFNGSIVKIIDDFLGQSIFIAHPAFCRENRLLYSIYGHCRPRNGAGTGVEVASGKEIAQIADAKTSSAVPPHLHLSLAWIDKDIPDKQLNWQLLHSAPGVTLINPLQIIE